MSHYCTLFTIMSHKSERNSDWNPWRDHNPERKTERIHKQNLNGRWWGRWVVKFDCHREKLFPVWWGQYCPILSVLISTLLIMQPTLKMIKKKKKRLDYLPLYTNTHTRMHAHTSADPRVWVPQIMQKSVFFQHPPSLSTGHWKSIQALHWIFITQHGCTVWQPTGFARADYQSSPPFICWIGILEGVCACVCQGQPFKQPMVYSSTSTPGSCDWLETWLTEWAVASGSMDYMLDNLPTWDWKAC